MESILLDFEKLFATIINPKNETIHLKAISKTIDIFERKYFDIASVSTYFLVKFLRKKFRELHLKLNQIEQN